MFYIGLYRDKHETILLSETIWPRALIFVEMCSNYTPWAKLATVGGWGGGSNFLHRLI